MTAPDYVTRAAKLLTEHAMCSVRGERMYCGMDLPAFPDASFHAAHQAEVLAAAGLIPTSTEWGVRHPFLVPDARTIEPKHRALYGDHWTILTRAVTDWKDASDD